MSNTMSQLPNWVIDLVAAVQHYEFIHGDAKEGEYCFVPVLEAVPHEVRVAADAVAEYKRQGALAVADNV